MIVSSTAQSQDAPHLSSPGDDSHSASAASSDYSQEPFVYENVRAKLHYESDGTGVREVFARIRVQSALGLQRVGQLLFDYNAANESVEIRSVRVVKADGSIVVTGNGPEAIQDLSAPVAREAPMYTDARQKHVSVAGLGIGDTLEYDVITTTIKPLIENQFWQTWNFVGDAICLDEQVDLDVPRDRALKVKAPSDVISNVHDDGNRRLYHWSTSTLKYSSMADVMKRSKSFDVATLLEGVRPAPAKQLLFSTFGSWGEIGRWYSEVAKDRRAVTPEIRSQADMIIKGASTDAAKAQALYSWVAANIRYVSLSFGLGRYQPHDATEVLNNRYGDCKDKSTLLEALLKAEGLEAEPVLVNSTHDIDPDMPSPLQFDHVITLLHLRGEDVWLDSTVGVGPYGYLLPQLRGKNALVASARSGVGLQTTPVRPQIPTTYRVLIHESDGKDGKVDLRLAFDTRGDLEVLLRLGFLQLPAEQMTNLINQSARSANQATGDLSIHDLKTSDPMNTAEPFHVEASISGAATKETGTGDFQKSLSEIRTSLASLLPESPSNSKNLDNLKVELGDPKEFFLTMESESTVAPYATVPTPDNVQVTEDFAAFDSTGGWDGKELRATWHLDLKAAEISANRFDEYNEFRRRVFASFDSNSPEVAFLLEARVARSPDDGNAYLNLGNSYLSMHKFEPAVQNLEKATELLPGNESAQLALGRAYLGAGQSDKAITTFERMIAMDHSAFALNNAAYYLGEQKVHMDVAEKWSKAAIKTVEEQLNQSEIGVLKKNSAQLTGNLAADWDTFGWIKFHEGDYGASEKYVRAAWEIANFTDVGCHLGLIYQTMGRKDDAIDTYARTLALVGTSRQLTDNEKEARHQLEVLLGDETLIQNKLQEARGELGSWRSIHVDNSARVSGSEKFIVIVGPGSKVEDIRPIQQNNPANELEPTIRASAMPQTFPDGTLRKLPRAGTLSCSSPTQPCTFTLLPPVPAAQVFDSLATGSAE